MTTGTFSGTNTVCSPPLYVSFSVRPLPAAPTFSTVAFVIVPRAFDDDVTPDTVALVIVLPGSVGIGRCPSPVPRNASGKMCTSLATSVPSGPGDAAEDQRHHQRLHPAPPRRLARARRHGR